MLGAPWTHPESGQAAPSERHRVLWRKRTGFGVHGRSERCVKTKVTIEYNSTREDAT